MQLQVGEMWIEHSAMILRSFCHFEKHVAKTRSIIAFIGLASDSDPLGIDGDVI